MKVSTRVEYGMLALADIALYSEDGSSVSAPEIADRENISPKYLEQILIQMKQAGLIRARKGLRGGYMLSRPAERIRLSEILHALDSSILEEMTSGENREERTLRNTVNDCVWTRLNSSIIEFAEGRTLGDIIQECRDKLSGGWDMYTI